MDKILLRKAHNFLFQAKKNDYAPGDLELLNDYLEFAKRDVQTPKKVALLLVSVNQNYWPYASQVFDDIKKFFLPGHTTDVFLWSDMPTIKEEQFNKKEKEIFLLKEETKKVLLPQKQGQLIFSAFQEYLEASYLWTQTNQQQAMAAATLLGLQAEFQPIDQTMSNLLLKNINEQSAITIITATCEIIRKQRQLQQCKKFEVEPIEWPFGTLLRYSMFLQEEEKLKEYDYIFYMDADMRIVNVVGDEILGNGLTMAEHPMYALRKEYVPPYEPNCESSAYIPRFGKILVEDGKPRLKPLYAAGGFQGGDAKEFISAMKTMRKSINKDFNKNYTAIWNDESHWNRYLFDYKGDLIVLSPSYIYPDSLIKEYYEKLWGRNYPPKIITLTKPFTLQKLDANRFASM